MRGLEVHPCPVRRTPGEDAQQTAHGHALLRLGPAATAHIDTEDDHQAGLQPHGGKYPRRRATLEQTPQERDCSRGSRRRGDCCAGCGGGLGGGRTGRARRGAGDACGRRSCDSRSARVCLRGRGAGRGGGCQSGPCGGGCDGRQGSGDRRGRWRCIRHVAHLVTNPLRLSTVLRCPGASLVHDVLHGALPTEIDRERCLE
mmetsp:Transcript_90916/g.252952  ORF Transcript_90916/g.252952 Transcript_90916/m.252952 type:complete len:201 (+) Transcript_90916:379-981(+)